MAILRQLKATFTGGVYSPAVQARPDLQRYLSGLKTAENVFVHVQGGVSNRAGFELVRQLPTTTLNVQIPFIAEIENAETYTVILSQGSIRFSRAGVPILEPSVDNITIADDSGDAGFTKVGHGFADGDFVEWASVNNLNLNGRTLEVQSVTADTFKLRRMGGGATLLFSETADVDPFSVRRHYAIAAPYASADVRQVTYAQDNDVMYLAHASHPPHKLSRLADDNWLLEEVDFTPNITPPVNVQGSVMNGEGHDPANAVAVTYVVAAIDAVTEEESLPSASVTLTNDLAINGARNNLTWNTVAGADRYAVYKDADGIFGFIGATRAPNFSDNNITEDTADGPQDGFNPFNVNGTYPRAVTMHEQRLTFASSNDDPQVVRLSQSAVLENFSSANPPKPDDAISFRVRSRDRQSVHAMVSTGAGLALFSSSTEWMVTGGSEDFLTPTNPVVRPQTRRGSYFLQPLLVGDVVMYAQARGGVVRDFSYSFEDDAFNGPDRTVLARHLFDNKRIVSWAYAQSPYSIIWAVRDDGVLLSLTYYREQDVWGWTTHTTDGVFESVVVIPEGDEDVLYATVKRTLNGVEYKFEERMRTRRVGKDYTQWFFVDCGLQYTGAATKVLTGLGHLDGVEVSILADGFVMPPQIVNDARIVFDREFTNVVVGLPYTSEIETLDLDLGALPEIGTMQGRETALAEVFVNVEDSRGMLIGHNRENLNPWKQRSIENYGEAIAAATEKFRIDLTPDWDNQGNVIVRQEDPLPMTVLAIGPDIYVGG